MVQILQRAMIKVMQWVKYLLQKGQLVKLMFLDFVQTRRYPFALQVRLNRIKKLIRQFLDLQYLRVVQRVRVNLLLQLVMLRGVLQALQVMKTSQFLLLFLLVKFVIKLTFIQITKCQVLMQQALLMWLRLMAQRKIISLGFLILFVRRGLLNSLSFTMMVESDQLLVSQKDHLLMVKLLHHWHLRTHLQLALHFQIMTYLIIS